MHQLPRPEALHDNLVRPVFSMSGLREELCAAIRLARERVYADFYILGGRSGEMVAEALAERYRAGLDVRVLLDRNLGTFWPLRPEALPVKALLDRRGVPVRLAATRRGGRMVRSRVVDHNKLVVLDGRTGYVGSTNLTDAASRLEDLAIRLEGPVVRQIEEQFRYDWALANSPEGDNGRSSSDLLFDASMEGLLANGSAAGLSTVRMVGVGPGRSTLAGALLNAINSTRQSLELHVHWLDAVDPVDALIRAHRRGVAVRVIVDPLKVGRYLPAGWPAPRTPRGMFNALAVHALRRAGVPVRFARLEPAIIGYHMKVAIFDGGLVVTGTANWTRRSLTLLTETVLEIAGGPVVGQLRRWFDSQWDTRTEEARVGLEARAYSALVNLLL